MPLASVARYPLDLRLRLGHAPGVENMVEPRAAAFSRSLDMRGGRPGVWMLAYPDEPINRQLEIPSGSLLFKLQSAEAGGDAISPGFDQGDTQASMVRACQAYINTSNGKQSSPRCPSRLCPSGQCEARAMSDAPR